MATIRKRIVKEEQEENNEFNHSDEEKVNKVGGELPNNRTIRGKKRTIDTITESSPSLVQLSNEYHETHPKDHGIELKPSHAITSHQPQNITERGSAQPQEQQLQPVIFLSQQPAHERWRNWWLRTVWTLIMITGFLFIIASGHLWTMLLILVLQLIVYKEVISVGIPIVQEKKLPWNRFIHWYFLACANYFLYGESVIFYFKPHKFVSEFLMGFATHHRFISFSLYCFGFVMFVMNLRKGHYRFQFSHFAWTHMCLLLVVYQSYFMVNNLFEGMIWFLLPVSLVIVNDITAYICGFFFGVTPLIKLSPKKTREGFVGALLLTILFGFFFSGLLARSTFLICPAKNFSTSSLTDVTCPIPSIFKVMRVSIFHEVIPIIPIFSIYPVQLHSIILSLFASLVAPFGGFFASGLKRAFKVKDFGDVLPGHGGLTDRFDCQFLMGLFSYMYFQSFIGVKINVRYLLSMAVSRLSKEELMQLIQFLQEFIESQ